jgi:hemerythrin
MIIWDDSMTTGLPEIDAQHKEIIEKFNEFSEAVASGMSPY